MRSVCEAHAVMLRHEYEQERNGFPLLFKEPDLWSRHVCCARNLYHTSRMMARMDFSH